MSSPSTLRALDGPAAPAAAGGPLDWIRAARPHQWVKSAFVFIGPLYGIAHNRPVDWVGVFSIAAAFALGSSACYVLNDIRDREADRAHPRKRRRPIAAGRVSVPAAMTLAGVLGALAAAAAGLVFVGRTTSGAWEALATVLVYLANTSAYSLGIKRVVILDVISLALGFVLRVLGGCAAAGVPPSTWLLNCTFFIAMFLAFGKRLGERRTSGPDAEVVRSVQRTYTDDLLRMAVVVTAVAALVTYAGYVEDQGERTGGLNLLWLSMLPATYGLLRCIVLLERGDYDDPTELAAHDRAFQLSAVVFAGLTVAAVLGSRTPV